jgi:hypothetical protein
MVAFIDSNRDDLRSSPSALCCRLRSTYHSAKTRPRSQRSVTDAVLVERTTEIWQGNYSVYGVYKTWNAMRRLGHDVGRDRVGRLMGSVGLAGARQGGKVVYQLVVGHGPRAGVPAGG